LGVAWSRRAGEQQDCDQHTNRCAAAGEHHIAYV
jgi:hypothetical protein